MGILSITLDVDAETFARWSAATSNLRRTIYLPVVAVGTLDPGLPPVPNGVNVTGADVLMDIGQACTRPERPEDPSALYAVLRYATALSQGTPGLTLDTATGWLDSHKKRVLSDEFGCGVALLVTSVIESRLRYADTETAILLQLLQTSQARSRCPDYFAIDPGNPTIAYVIEAKGTQQGDTYCSGTQIPRGCQQVAAVQLVPPGPQLLRVVVGTALQIESRGTHSKVFLGDPTEIEPEPYSFSRPLPQVIPLVHYLRVARLIGDERYEAALIRHHLVEGRGARWLHSTAVRGASVAAERPWEGPRRRVGPHAYVGSQVVVNGPTETIGFFFGLREDVRDHLLEGDVLEAARLASKPDLADFSAPNEWFVGRDDGTLLSMSIL